LFQLTQAFSAPVLAGIGVLIAKAVQFLITREKSIKNTTLSNLLQDATNGANALMQSLVLEAKQAVVDVAKGNNTWTKAMAEQVKADVLKKFDAQFPALWKSILTEAGVDLPQMLSSLLESHVNQTKTAAPSTVPSPAPNSPPGPSSPSAN